MLDDGIPVSSSQPSLRGKVPQGADLQAVYEKRVGKASQVRRFSPIYGDAQTRGIQALHLFARIFKNHHKKPWSMPAMAFPLLF